MSADLKISIGQFTDKGRKEINQDFHGAYVPKEPLLSTKGIAVALADGISSSDVSQIASNAAVNGFLEDYYCTSDAWSVKKSAQRVLVATNSWLYSQTQQSQYRYEKDRGYVCTFSALVMKSNTAHIFHAGDTRIYRIRENTLEQLTQDHRILVSLNKSYLSRALGISAQLDLDYRSEQMEQHDVFVLATDGVYEHIQPPSLITTIQRHGDDLGAAAEEIVKTAFASGSTDNLTIQIVRINELPAQKSNEIYTRMSELPFAPMLEARMEFDGFRIIREVHASSRSHVFLAEDMQSGQRVILKTPSIDLRDDPAYLERFLMEEWIARRINSAHVLKPCAQTRKRNYLYIAMEFIDGQTLSQWMIDNPKPKLQAVRDIVEQIARGLLAFHRMEMLHQDLRPENIMIDSSGTVKIIDFGSTRVAGIMELVPEEEQYHLLGTAQYTAPEYFLGEAGTERSDLFSLGVITYHMLSGKLPYGAQVSKIRTRAAQKKLSYDSVLDEEREIPVWVDEAIRKAVHPLQERRYEELSEFVFDLRHPNKDFVNRTRPPLMERNPVIFWKIVSLILAVVVVILLLK